VEIVPIEIFGVGIEVPFLAPQALSQAKFEEFGAKVCDSVSGLGLRPEQLRLKKWDDLYGFELSAQFFGDNGTLAYTADRVKVGIRNARTAADWTVIHQTLLRFYKIMEFSPRTVTLLSAHVHAKFPSLEERDEYLATFAHNPLIARPAAMGYVRISDWEKDIRLLIEQSNVSPNSVFIGWDTQFPNAQDWDSFLGSLPVVMENSANLFEIGFEPFKQTA
jgi:hypothetical protein